MAGEGWRGGDGIGDKQELHEERLDLFIGERFGLVIFPRPIPSGNATQNSQLSYVVYAGLVLVEGPAVVLVQWLNRLRPQYLQAPVCQR